MGMYSRANQFSLTTNHFLKILALVPQWRVESNSNRWISNPLDDKTQDWDRHMFDLWTFFGQVVKSWLTKKTGNEPWQTVPWHELHVNLELGTFSFFKHPVTGAWKKFFFSKFDDGKSLHLFPEKEAHIGCLSRKRLPLKAAYSNITLAVEKIGYSQFNQIWNWDHTRTSVLSPSLWGPYNWSQNHGKWR